MNDLINKIYEEIDWGNIYLEELLDVRSTFKNEMIFKIKQNLNEITIVQACRVLNIDYRQAVNEYIGEDLYE